FPAVCSANRGRRAAPGVQSDHEAVAVGMVVGMGIAHRLVIAVEIDALGPHHRPAALYIEKLGNLGGGIGGQELLLGALGLLGEPADIGILPLGVRLG